MKCPFYYYISKFNQYKCIENKFCPSNYLLLIEEKEKCIDDCNKDDINKYKYENKCLKECPINTINYNFNCKDNNNNNITLLTSTNHIYFNNTDDYITQFVKRYMNIFNYTNSHLSAYTSNDLNLIIYKNSISFSIYDPRNGEKIIYNDICNNDPVIVEENIEKKISDLDSFI